MNTEQEITSDLTISDLKIINNLIELITQKGLIRPADFTIIGPIYEKINALVKSVSDKPSN